MNRNQKISFVLLTALIALFLLVILHLTGVINPHLTWAFFSPKGTIAFQERRLFLIATSIMLVVAIPMLATLFIFVHKFRADRAENINAEYRPEWNFNIWLQILCWAIPVTVITIIGVLNWKSTHVLDPYNPIPSDKPPITIEVVALQWKWLFIYPEQGIATVNFLEFPEKTPLKFDLTADAPMNSFWIPQLGSQIYEMPGMETHLNLIANETGDFYGSDAEISGAGFADMKFVARSATQQDFNAWVASVKNGGGLLDSSEYDRLALPATVATPLSYASINKNIFYSAMAKYMAPETNNGMQNMQMEFTR